MKPRNRREFMKTVGMGTASLILTAAGCGVRQQTPRLWPRHLAKSSRAPSLLLRKRKNTGNAKRSH